MKAAKITVGGVSYFLVLDGEGMFQIRDDFGSTKLLLEAVEPDTREAFEATCSAAALLAERGELIRRRLGYEPGKIPERDDFLLLVRPFEVVDLKNAVIKAITLGYGREVATEDGGEYDEGLEELNQKKNTIRRAEYYRVAALCGLSVTEALFMPPGEVFDLWELYLKAHGKKEREDYE